MQDILAIFIVFGSVGLLIWKFLDTRHRERMTMIEKGVNPTDFKGVSVREMFRMNPLSSLKWGLLAMFVGAGLMVATYLERTLYWHDSVYPASMLIFGGLALIIFYQIAARKLQ